MRVNGINYNGFNGFNVIKNRSKSPAGNRVAKTSELPSEPGLYAAYNGISFGQNAENNLIYLKNPKTMGIRLIVRPFKDRQVTFVDLDKERTDRLLKDENREISGKKLALFRDSFEKYYKENMEKYESLAAKDEDDEYALQNLIDVDSLSKPFDIFNTEEFPFTTADETIGENSIKTDSTDYAFNVLELANGINFDIDTQRQEIIDLADRIEQFATAPDFIPNLYETSYKHFGKLNPEFLEDFCGVMDSASGLLTKVGNLPEVYYEIIDANPDKEHEKEFKAAVRNLSCVVDFDNVYFLGYIEYMFNPITEKFNEKSADLLWRLAENANRKVYELYKGDLTPEIVGSLECAAMNVTAGYYKAYTDEITGELKEGAPSVEEYINTVLPDTEE